MENIRMSELKAGDIITHKYNLHNRESFLVTKITDRVVECQSRKTNKTIKKQKQGSVIFLRKDGD